MKEIKLAETWEGNSLFSRTYTLYWLGGSAFGVSKYDTTCTNNDGSLWEGYDDDLVILLPDFTGLTVQEAICKFEEDFELSGWVQ